MKKLFFPSSGMTSAKPFQTLAKCYFNIYISIFFILQGVSREMCCLNLIMRRTKTIIEMLYTFGKPVIVLLCFKF